MSIIDNHPDRDELEVEGHQMIGLIERLWPIYRTLAGPGIRESLQILGSPLGGLNISQVRTGARVLDWIVPEEWHLRTAFIETPDDRRICDIGRNNLHVVGYSTAVDSRITLDELQSHLYSLPEQPEAVPYVTSYYERKWGFCLSHRERSSLDSGVYRVLIDASHVAGSLDYGQFVIPGRSPREVLFSTYCCHPAMANNELSGPVLAVALAKWLLNGPPRYYTYRFVFGPEMIGAAAVLDSHRDHLRASVLAAFNLTCLGDERAWSFLPSRHGDTYADRVAKHVLRHSVGDYRAYEWHDRGSDESMYCAPGIDIPMVSIMRSKYGEYPEYHTSSDVVGRVVTARGLAESLSLYRTLVDALEADCVPRSTILGEPQLGRRGLYPQTSMKGSTAPVKDMLDLISHSDGETRLLDIADRCGKPLWSFIPDLEKLLAAGVLER
jgi:aminopeptidase-like protein